MFTDLVPGTGSVAISVGVSTALDAASLLQSLDRYPFGCSEQITSRALPLLYVNELASEAHLALDGAIDLGIARRRVRRKDERGGREQQYNKEKEIQHDAGLDHFRFGSANCSKYSLIARA